MLLPNNPDIETDVLMKKIRSVQARLELHGIALNDAPPSVANADSTEVIPQEIVESHVVASDLPQAQSTLPDIPLKRRLGQIPFVGSALIWIGSIFRLNRIRHKIALEFDELRVQITQTREQLQQSHQELAQVQKSYASITQHLMERLWQMEVLGLARNFERYDDQLQKTNNRIANLTREIRQLGTNTVSLKNQASSELPRSAQLETDPAEIAPSLNHFYVEFEDNFRGTQEDISKRLRVYLPYMEKFKGNPEAIVVDVGCGRGEWLGLLSANHIAGVGIDMNAAMIDACKEKGFNAYCADAIDYLRSQPENSVAAVTGFHIIEHLSFETLLALFDATLYALRPDGLIIFETPNPENVMVGACNFYFDPTHRNPIVPVVAQFMAKQRGFAHADILRLHPYPDHYRVVEDSELAKRFNAAFYGPQDFAIVAWKNYAN